MVTGSTGTSWYMPLVVVGTALILSTTSCALDHLAEDRVAPALGGLGGVVEELVVGHVDEELGRGRIRVAGPGHGDGVGVIGQAVVGFVLDGRPGGLLVHLGIETAALDHEGGDDPVKNGAVKKAVFDVLQKIGHRIRSLVRVQLQGDVPHTRFQFYQRMTPFCPGARPGSQN